MKTGRDIGYCWTLRRALFYRSDLGMISVDLCMISGSRDLREPGLRHIHDLNIIMIEKCSPKRGGFHGFQALPHRCGDTGD